MTSQEPIPRHNAVASNDGGGGERCEMHAAERGRTYVAATAMAVAETWLQRHKIGITLHLNPCNKAGNELLRWLAGGDSPVALQALSYCCRTFC